jgi:DNA-binding transcriptional LysR family regulator
MQRTEQISRRLKLRQLNVLLAVAQWGSMAKAADHLAISQPVVSKAIAELEHVVGVRLLDRGPYGVEPTLYGRALLKRSIAILMTSERASASSSSCPIRRQASCELDAKRTWPRDCFPLS